ncbi:hypothetical protein C8R47DRAFT_1163574 [Mycena vitilis]|nr:hypothetical protein C8R47DRAFT_1163574 [Mycena vitilis]
MRCVTRAASWSSFNFLRSSATRSRSRSVFTTSRARISFSTPRRSRSSAMSSFSEAKRRGFEFRISRSGLPECSFLSLRLGSCRFVSGIWLPARSEAFLRLGSDRLLSTTLPPANPSRSAVTVFPGCVESRSDRTRSVGTRERDMITIQTRTSFSREGCRSSGRETEEGPKMDCRCLQSSRGLPCTISRLQSPALILQCECEGNP